MSAFINFLDDIPFKNLQYAKMISLIIDSSHY